MVQGHRMPSQSRRRASKTINLLWLTIRICMGSSLYSWARKVSTNFFLSISSHLVWTWASSEPPCATAPDQKGLQRTLRCWGWQILGQVLRITGFGGIISKCSDTTNHKGMNSAGASQAPEKICSMDIPQNIPLNSSWRKSEALLNYLPGIPFSGFFIQLAPNAKLGLNVPHLRGHSKFPCILSHSILIFPFMPLLFVIIYLFVCLFVSCLSPIRSICPHEGREDVGFVYLYINSTQHVPGPPVGM